MTNSTYLYLFFSSLTILLFFYVFFNYKPNKDNLNSKILLKNLLESFDLELPEELKHLESSSTDPQKFS